MVKEVEDETGEARFSFISYVKEGEFYIKDKNQSLKGTEKGRNDFEIILKTQSGEFCQKANEAQI